MNAFQGLLEPYARITCTCGSEGSGAQQCAPLTRLITPPTQLRNLGDVTLRIGFGVALPGAGAAGGRGCGAGW